MTGFGALADALRDEVVMFHRRQQLTLAGTAAEATIETNSGFVERRGAPLLQMLGEHAGIETVDGLSVLDMGCGFGALSVYFAWAGARVTGIDSNASRLAVGTAVARRAGLAVELVHARMERGPVAEAAFDLVVMNNSLCYLVSPAHRRAALAGAWHSLRPGGTIVVREPNRWHPVDSFSHIPLVQLLPPDAAVTTARALGRPRSRCRPVSRRQLRAELRAVGFERVSPATAVADKPRWAPAGLSRYQHAIGRRPER